MSKNKKQNLNIIDAADAINFNFLKITQEILMWHLQNGRHDLPWQVWNTCANTDLVQSKSLQYFKNQAFLKKFYYAWLAEIMLQQTQVVSVLGYFQRFTEIFADIFMLANAHQDDVLAAWQGLGYYSRARYLHASSQYLQNLFYQAFMVFCTDQSLQDIPKSNMNIGNQDWLSTALEILDFESIFLASGTNTNNKNTAFEACLKLKGVGQSTAAALASCVFNQPISIFDGNVRRVLSRIFAVNDQIPEKNIINNDKHQKNNADNILKAIAQNLIEDFDNRSTSTRNTKNSEKSEKLKNIKNISENSYILAHYTQSLMDLGALICKPQPLCLKTENICPMQKNICQAHAQQKIDLYPSPKIKLKVKDVNLYTYYFAFDINDRRYLLWHQQNIDNMKIWQGMYVPLIFAQPNFDFTHQYNDKYNQCMPKNMNHIQNIQNIQNISNVHTSKERVLQKIEFKFLNIFPPYQHILTHRKLLIHPSLIVFKIEGINDENNSLNKIYILNEIILNKIGLSHDILSKINSNNMAWYNQEDILAKGVPKAFSMHLKMLYEINSLG